MYHQIEITNIHCPDVRGKNGQTSDQSGGAKKKEAKPKKDGRRQCQAYMCVDLFPILRMKRDIEEARKNLRKVGLSSSAESVIESKTGKVNTKKTFCRVDSISHESVLMSAKQNENLGSRERFKNALTKWMQQIGKTSSKQERQKKSEVDTKASPCGYDYLNQVADSNVTMVTEETHGYDNLNRWNPFTVDKDRNNVISKKRNLSNSTSDLRYNTLFSVGCQGEWPAVTV